MSRLLTTSGLFDELKGRLIDGLPVFGTCAGMILCAADVLDGRPDQRGFDLIDLTVRRNGYGRQLDSFEADLDVDGLADAVPRRVHPGAARRACRARRRGARPSRRRACPRARRALYRGSVPSRTHRRRTSARAVPRLAHRLTHVQNANGARMSGHSKWATIKHKKGAADKARGKLFAKLARQIEVSAKSGGDVDSNPTLRTAVQKAKAARMTNDAIDRAIKRGTGDDDGGHLREHHVRGLRPGRRGADDRRTHRQPQPDGRRDPQHLLQARRVDGRTRSGRLAVPATWRDHHRRRRRRGHDHDGRHRGGCRRRHRRGFRRSG